MFVDASNANMGDVLTGETLWQELDGFGLS